MEEEWRKIEGYDNYSISNLGQVRNDKTKKIRKQQKDKYNYCYVCFRTPDSDIKHSRKQVHRLVGQAFIPNPENLPQIHHIDNDPTNNNVSNLRWVTNIENNQSVNRISNIGCVSSYTLKNGNTYYKSKVIIYGKNYQKNSKDREICEEWLKNRRYEIENELEITKDKKY